MNEEKFLKRDWFILPTLGLLTICLLFGSTELIARHFYFNSRTSVEDCLVMGDPLTGVRAIPHCVCRARGFESPWVEYRFDKCGQRANMECGQDPLGSYKIVMIGSSAAMGYEVESDKTVAELLPSLLTRRAGRKVALNNAALMSEQPAAVALRFKDLAASKPDLILWLVTSWDIEEASILAPKKLKADEIQAPLGATRKRLLQAFAGKSIFETASGIAETAGEVFSSSRTKFLLQHLLYQSQSQYITAALMGGGGTGESLKVKFSAEWQDHLLQFEKSYSDVEYQAKEAGLPVVVAYLPSRVQAAMLSSGKWPAGYDPFNLDNELRRIVERHSGLYLGLLQDFRAIPNSERGYYPVDSHPNARGNAMIANILAQDLIRVEVPPLKTTALP